MKTNSFPSNSIYSLKTNTQIHYVMFMENYILIKILIGLIEI